MKISRTVQKSDKSSFGKLYRHLGWRGGHVTFFAEDDKFMGVGGTAHEAVVDLRAERGRYKKWGYQNDD